MKIEDSLHIIASELVKLRVLRETKDDLSVRDAEEIYTPDHTYRATKVNLPAWGKYSSGKEDA